MTRFTAPIVVLTSLLGCNESSPEPAAPRPAPESKDASTVAPKRIDAETKDGSAIAPPRIAPETKDGSAIAPMRVDTKELERADGGPEDRVRLNDGITDPPRGRPITGLEEDPRRIDGHDPSSIEEPNLGEGGEPSLGPGGGRCDRNGNCDDVAPPNRGDFLDCKALCRDTGMTTRAREACDCDSISDDLAAPGS